MSMLAERKKKQKWSLNPRGKLWSEDSNKFGQKLLEKMGWSNGKGLGAKENGIVEHIKIPYKNDNKGMGFKERDDQWTEHESNFGNLLKTLSNDKEFTAIEKVEIKSLEEKSQKSKVRVHYQKFTRGKDISKYSMKDLANIFGKKSLDQNNEEENNTEQLESNSNFLYTGQSSVDYFKKKLPNLNKMNVVQNRERSDSESEIKVGFGFQSLEKPNKTKETFVSYVNGDSVEESANLKRKCTGDDELEPHKKKKKSKLEKKKTGVNGETMGLNNPAFDPLHSNVVVEKHVLNTIVESFAEENSETSISNETVSLKNAVIDSEEIKKVKIKKNKKFKLNNENISYEETSIETDIVGNSNANTYEVEKMNEFPKEENNEKKKNKKKYKKHDESGIINPVLNDTNSFTENSLCNNSVAVNEFEVVRKKKKKSKQIEESLGVDNSCLSLNETQCNEIISNEFEIKRKNKKNKKLNNFNEDLQTEANCGSDNLALNVDEVDINKISNESTITNEFEVKRKNRKRKSVSESTNVDQGNLKRNDVDVNESSLTCEFEVMRKIKKSKKKNTDEKIENLGLDNLAVKIDDADNDGNNSSLITNDFEVKRKNKKKENVSESTNVDQDNLNTIDVEVNESLCSSITSEFEVKRKIKKGKKKNTDKTIENLGIDNLAVKINDAENSENNSSLITNDFEVKRKNKRKENMPESTNVDQDNLNKNDVEINESTSSSNTSEFEVKKKNKKTKKKSSGKNIEENLGLDNFALKINDGDTIENTSSLVTNEFEVKRKIKKGKKLDKNNELGVDNIALNLNDSNTENINPEASVVETDLMFNIVSTPIIKKSEDKSSTSSTNNVKRRKSVRFNDVTQEHIIPNKDDSKDTNLRNELHDINSQVISNGLKTNNNETKNQKVNLKQRMNSISQKLDVCQAEVENDINEAKLKTVQMEDMMIGQVGNPDGKSEAHPEGSLLKFKHIKFGPTPKYMQNMIGPKKSYKNLIKGDIIVKFQNSNLHDIHGYASGNMM